MNRIYLILSLVLLVSACENQDKPVVVGVNEDGQQLTVNASGDTIVYDANQIEIQDEEIADANPAIKAENDGTYKFGLNLKKGQKYPFKIATSSTNTQFNGTESQTMIQKATTALEYEVKEIKDSIFVLDVTYKQFSESMSDGKETIGFDTNKGEPENPMALDRWNFNKAIVGKTFQMEVSESGKVQNISNLWKLREQVKETMKEGLSAEELQGLDQFLAMALSDEAMQMQFEESMAYYPKKKVKEGESWSRNESEGNASSTVTYTFENIKDNIATIKIKGSSTGSDSRTEDSGLKIFQSLEGKVNGTVQINVNSGWVKDAQMSKDETIKMTQEYQGQKLNLSSETKSTTKIN